MRESRVAIYKYGIIRPGVLVRWRQRQLIRGLIARIRKLSAEASTIVSDPRPDVIAHSFGTFLLGHALHQDPELCVGRVITLGCILRPDFDWGTLVQRGQVGAVLNHYGTKDLWARIAHRAIPDAGPAGRRGFDFYPDSWPADKRNPEDRVLFNVPAEGFGHSQFFANSDGPPSTLHHLFSDVWEPFLTTRDMPDVADALDYEPFLASAGDRAAGRSGPSPVGSGGPPTPSAERVKSPIWCGQV